MIKANTCTYCGGPYTIDNGGCRAKCADMQKHQQMVYEAANSDPEESGEYEALRARENWKC